MGSYFEFARIAFLKMLAYRLRYVTGIVTYFLNVTVYYFIWQAIYSNSPDVAGFDMGQIVTYVAVGWMIRSFYFNNVDRDIATEVLEGKIAVSLIKPVDQQLMYIAQAFGESFFRAFMFTLPISFVVVLIYPVKGPASITAGLLFVVSCLLSFLIFTLINFIVGTAALELHSIVGVIRAKYFIVEFTSGLLLPLTFFPGWLQKGLAFLPFPHISWTPLQIYLGRAAGTDAFKSLGVQAVWVAVLLLLGRFWWNYSTRRLSILGG
jgi:viologen exporter family transport system permease protein